MAIELTTATSAELSGIRQSLYTQVDLTRIFPNGQWTIAFGQLQIDVSRYGSIADFKNCQFLKHVNCTGSTLQQLLNAQDLINLENSGTTVACDLSYHPLEAVAINQFFTDLPPTTKTATLRFIGNTGSATCDTTIATNKGYTVVTS